MFDAQQEKKGLIMMAIDEAHPCTTHGTCFITADSVHAILTCTRKSELADYIMANEETRKPSDPVPDHLLNVWGITSASAPSTSRPCGLKGPRDSSGDMKAAILEGFGFAMGAMMQMSLLQAQANTGIPSSHQVASSTTHAISRSPSPVNHVRSSSPPAPEDELDVCIDRFSNTLTRKIPSDILEHAKSALKDEDFDVQLLGKGTSSEIMHLTGLKQGPATGLKRFAEEYNETLKGKRARRNFS
ncbi:hypothetical protein EV359DRAFT_87073 [Lentinula novae-zelandiae]|nr:hypothetical protein EV359DRAFT_87073 [Lentinula novae-zelandiae]